MSRTSSRGFRLPGAALEASHDPGLGGPVDSGSRAAWSEAFCEAGPHCTTPTNLLSNEIGDGKDDIKAGAVRLVLDEGKTVAQVAVGSI